MGLMHRRGLGNHAPRTYTSPLSYHSGDDFKGWTPSWCAGKGLPQLIALAKLEPGKQRPAKEETSSKVRYHFIDWRQIMLRRGKPSVGLHDCESGPRTGTSQ